MYTKPYRVYIPSSYTHGNTLEKILRHFTDKLFIFLQTLKNKVYKTINYVLYLQNKDQLRRLNATF